MPACNVPIIRGTWTLDHPCFLPLLSSTSSSFSSKQNSVSHLPDSGNCSVILDIRQNHQNSDNHDLLYAPGPSYNDPSSPPSLQYLTHSVAALLATPDPLSFKSPGTSFSLASGKIVPQKHICIGFRFRLFCHLDENLTPRVTTLGRSWHYQLIETQTPSFHDNKNTCHFYSFLADLQNSITTLLPCSLAHLHPFRFRSLTIAPR